MNRRRKRWPNYALGALENALVTLTEIESLGKEAQEAARDGEYVQTIIILTDIRTKAAGIKAELVLAREGTYE